ncbi:hypothetical protein K438DRAFT_1759827 [Mycena galopus ATCC 62051]|nr:hypothetical protein K438DRAFT_1759827 [Mycena galopus ATCC 62051]
MPAFSSNIEFNGLSTITVQASDSATWRSVPQRSWHTTTIALRLSALVLHSVLIATHLTLFAIWTRGSRLWFTIAPENQKLVSFLVVATTTAFGTIFSALLLFVTQKLATRRSIQKDQMLTTTHENAAAWAEIGAAISLLWNRRAARSAGSVIGLLSAIVYLAAVSGLHITSSSLFSSVTFNSTRSFDTGTQGLPAYNSTAHGDASTPYDDMVQYAARSLYFISSVLTGNTGETNLSLQGGTLYEVPDIVSPLPGNATSFQYFRVEDYFPPIFDLLEFYQSQRAIMKRALAGSLPQGIAGTSHQVMDRRLYSPIVWNDVKIERDAIARYSIFETTQA